MGNQWRGPSHRATTPVGRDGNAVDLIVDHWTVVAQLVSEDDTAYHAGNYAVNLRSIGIEHEAGPAGPPNAPARCNSIASFATQ